MWCVSGRSQNVVRKSFMQRIMSRGGLSTGCFVLRALWILSYVKAADLQSGRRDLNSLMIVEIRSVTDSGIPRRQRLLHLFLLSRFSTCDCIWLNATNNVSCSLLEITICQASSSCFVSSLSVLVPRAEISCDSVWEVLCNLNWNLAASLLYIASRLAFRSAFDNDVVYAQPGS